MALSYSAGLEKVLDIAERQRNGCQDQKRNVPLLESLGRTVAEDILSPRSSPEHDTSAMDGYAIRSHDTLSASPETPVLFRIEGIIAAGDVPSSIPNVQRMKGSSPAATCVEIMTGAIFPRGYDACVKVEDTTPLGGGAGKGYMFVTKPVPRNENKRFAGCDISEGDILVKQGEAIRPSHIMPLASLGLETAPVVRKPRVGIWSTGKEMMNGNGSTRDANGPYLTAALQELGVEVDFLGILEDDPFIVRHHLQEAARSGEYDVLMTSGAVSKGRFDHVRGVLDEMGAEIVFHGLSIRPGHPVLFALIPGQQRETAFFGLPGNPVAAAACFRFLTVPYLRALQGQAIEQPILARLLRRPQRDKPEHGCHGKQGTDCFRHGGLSTTATGQLVVEPSSEQSPAKVGPFTTANCWIHLRPEPESPADLVECYPISASGTLHLSTFVLN